MQGFKFLVLDQQGAAVNHGIIAQTITPEKYLCQFARKPTSCRVVRIEEIETWNLFPDDDSMNNFVSALNANIEPPPQTKAPEGSNGEDKTDEPEEPEKPPAPTKPPASKKKAKKKSKRSK